MNIHRIGIRIGREHDNTRYAAPIIGFHRDGGDPYIHVSTHGYLYIAVGKRWAKCKPYGRVWDHFPSSHNMRYSGVL